MPERDSVGETLHSTPTTTLFFVATCCTLYLVQMISNIPRLQSVTLSPALVMQHHEWHRLISHAFYHGGWMHLGMNMMSTLAISGVLEKRVGSVCQALSTTVALVTTSVLYVALAAVWSNVNTTIWNQQAVGFSGVLFYMTVLESGTGASRTRSVFGFFDVPATFYPWILLVMIQLFMPNISFLGHLAGILTGHLQLAGCLACVLVRNEATLRRAEGWSACQRIASIHTGFVTTPPGAFDRDHQLFSQGAGSSAFSAFRGFIERLQSRRRTYGSNAHIFSLLPGADSDVDDFGSDEEWSGLPDSSNVEQEMV